MDSYVANEGYKSFTMRSKGENRVIISQNLEEDLTKAFMYLILDRN